MASRVGVVFLFALLALLTQNVAGQSVTIYLNPYTASPQWDGSCTSGGACTSSSAPCGLTGSATLNNTLCTNIVFVSNAQISSATINAITPVTLSTVTHLSMSGQPTFIGAMTFTNFVMDFPSSGSMVLQPTQAITFSGCTFNSSVSGAGIVIENGPKYMVTFANSVFNGQGVQFSIQSASPLYFSNTPFNSVSLTTWNPIEDGTWEGTPSFSLGIQNCAITSSAITGHWYQINLISTVTVQSTTIVAPTPFGSNRGLQFVSSGTTTFTESTLSGCFSLITVLAPTIYLNPPSTFITLPTTWVGKTSITGQNIVAAASSGSTTPINYLSGVPSSLSQTSLGSTAYINWGTVNITSYLTFLYSTVLYPMTVVSQGPSASASFSGCTLHCGSAFCVNLVGPSTDETLNIGWSSNTLVSPPSCPLMLSGYMEVNPSGPGTLTTLSSFCANSTGATISGSNILEITGTIAPGGPITFNDSIGGLLLHSIGVIPGSSVTFPNSSFMYTPDSTTSQITTSGGVMAPASVVVEWKLSNFPPLNTPYPLLNDPTGLTHITGISAPFYSISLSQSSDKTQYSYTFYAQSSCNASCDVFNVDKTSPCISSAQCPCTNPWYGPLCDCDTTLMPAEFECSPQGGQAWSFNYSYSYPYTIPTVVTIPSGYSLLPPTQKYGVNTGFASSVLLKNDSQITVRGSLTFNDVLNIYTSLYPVDYNGTCNVQSSSQVYASLGTSTLTSVNMVIDVSKMAILPASSDCIANETLSIIYIEYLSTATTELPINVTITDTSNPKLADFNFTFYLIDTAEFSTSFDPTALPPIIPNITVTLPTYICYSTSIDATLSGIVMGISYCGPPISPPPPANPPVSPPTSSPPHAPPSSAPHAPPSSAPHAPTSTPVSPGPTATPVTPTPSSTPSSPTPTSTPTPTPATSNPSSPTSSYDQLPHSSPSWIN